MAIDTRQKRMSALYPMSVWRGGIVDPTETGFTSGNRVAAAFLYSGITISAAAFAIGRQILRNQRTRLSVIPNIDGERISVLANGERRRNILPNLNA